MQLSKFTDYSFRVLIALGTSVREKRYTAEELAIELNTSEHHLKKVVQRLAQKGYILAAKGRNGGLTLSRPAAEINLGEVLLDMEENMNIVGCFADANDCPLLHKGCRLKGLITDALSDFVAKFHHYTLADII
jgi:Rrf2 family nitric oxide-sensitive transcriptional repressor